MSISSEHMRSSKSRPYRMSRRAELVDQTRERITAATARLHTTVGPANTSVASIAEEAGVTRLTVYRHFADLDVLFEACRAHWRAENPPPDARLWPETAGLEARARRALSELYAWYGEHAEELFPIYRDMTTMPDTSQESMRSENRRLADLLVADGAADGDPGRQMRAVAGHLLDYRTWRSLVIEQDLSDAEAVEIGVRLLAVLATSRSEGPAAPSDGRRRRSRPSGSRGSS
jgi:AcrR family transcriptional regulator